MRVCYSNIYILSGIFFFFTLLFMGIRTETISSYLRHKLKLGYRAYVRVFFPLDKVREISTRREQFRYKDAGLVGVRKRPFTRFDNISNEILRGFSTWLVVTRTYYATILKIDDYPRRQDNVGHR